MGESFLKQVTTILHDKKKHRAWLAMFLCLAILVTTGVSAIFKMTGVAMTHKEKVLNCQYTVSGGPGYADYVVHVHNDDCYDADGNLVCPLPEIGPHVHTADCYTTVKTVICGQEESDGHVHTADCYTKVRGELTCTDESEGHEHSDACYSWSEELTCGIAEGAGAHKHTKDCYESHKELTCGQLELHTHDKDCYDEAGNLTCGKLELNQHVHGDECFEIVELSDEEVAARAAKAAEAEAAKTEGETTEGEEPKAEGETAEGEEPKAEGETEETEGEEKKDDKKKSNEPDPTADVESAAQWAASVAGVTLTGNWRKDVVNIARSQLGYKQSSKNFQVQENGAKKFYTRYGDWYGIPYGDWCAMFVSFCLNYAGVSEWEIPYDCGCTTWINQLLERGMYVSAGFVEPKVGNLIFFDFDMDGLSDHVGLVNKVAGSQIETIEGNHTSAVQTFIYDSSNPCILGYGILPTNPNGPADEEEEEFTLAVLFDEANLPAQTFEGETATMSVFVDAPEGAFPEGTRMEVKDVEAEKYMDALNGVVDESVTVTKAHAVDITFYNAAGEEIQPKKPIKVTMTSALVAEIADPVLIHVDGEGQASKVEQSDSAADEVAFEADSFSVYVIAETEEIVVDFLTGDGKTLKVTVNFPEGANIPYNAELEVKEITQDDEGWAERSARLAHTLSEEYGNVYISDARFLTISILVDGKEYEPEVPVEIQVSYTDAMQTEYTVDCVDTDPNGLNTFAESEEEPELESHFAVIHYTGGTAKILDSTTENAEDTITESATMTPSFSDYDFVNFDQYEAREAVYSGSFAIGGAVTANQVIASAVKASAPKAPGAGTAPAHDKSLTDNNNGTYTLGLSVTGDADTTAEANDVNVIIVYDVSSSMTIYHAPSATGRYAANSGFSTDYPQLYRRNGNNSYTALNNDTYTGTVYTRTGNFGRYNYTEYIGQRYSALWRADEAEKTLYDFTEALFRYQNTEKDNINAALVTFDADAGTLVDWTTEKNDILNVINGSGTSHANIYGSGTNWEGAMVEAADLVENVPQDAPTYVIFITDGAPTQSQTQRTKTTDSDRMYDHAKDDARDVYTAVTATHGEFFGIYAYGQEADWLASLMYYAYNGSDPAQPGTTFSTPGYYTAADSAALTSAINEIFQKIVETLGITGVSIDDGTTSAVETSSGSIANLLVVEDSYQYWLSLPVTAGTGGSYTFTMPDKATGDNVTYTATESADTVTITWGESNSVTYSGEISFNTLTIEWTQATSFYNYNPPAATFNEDSGAVDWNLAPVGTLLDGVTYTVTFECYPSQYTLDLIADLKNGFQSYDSLDSEIKKYLLQSGDDYILATNTEATLTYTDSRTTDGQQTATYDNPDPVGTSAVKSLAIAKEWENVLDGRSSGTGITMHVTRDGVDRYEVTLNDDNDWSDSKYVSVGIMTVDESGNVEMKTTGHDYSFSEPANLAYYWELDVPTVHPMMINAVDTILLMLKDDEIPDAMKSLTAPARYVSGGETYYKLTDSKYYVVDEASASLTATNYRRSTLNITKVVNEANAPADALFTYTATVTDKNGDDVWFSISDGENFVTNTDTITYVSGATEETKDGAATGYYFAASGAEITFKLQAGWNLRFTNLPTGTTYEVTESSVMPDESFSLESVAGARDYDFEYDEAGNEISHSTESTGAVDGAKISGEIGNTNSRYTMTFTNKYSTAEVQLKKVDEEGENLSGAAFTLSRLDGSWRDIQENIKPGDTASSTPNPVDLGGLGIGRYRLTETAAPDGYVIFTKHICFEVYKDTDGTMKVTLTDEEGTRIESTDAVEISSSTSGSTTTYLITVTNSPGAVLPQTGGAGTMNYTLAGMALILFAGLTLGVKLYGRRRKAGDARA